MVENIVSFPGIHSMEAAHPRFASRNLYTSCSLYKYSPLLEAEDEIRLLTLLPDKFNSQVRIELEIVTLDPDTDTLPAYEALSYTWGSKKHTERIFVASKDNSNKLQFLEVTRNLAIALEHLRNRHTSRRLWIDAICIDQQSLSERENQAKRMGVMYKHADRVVAWLGSGSKSTSMAMTLCSDLRSKIEWSIGEGLRASKDVESIQGHWGDKTVPLPYTKAQVEAICHLIYRPWFERVWIQQEIRLAHQKKSIVQCGRDQMAWPDFCVTISCLAEKTFTRDVLKPKFYGYHARLSLLANLGRQDMNRCYIQLLHRTRACRCADPQDRIYGLLSLSSVLKVQPVVDYKKPVAVVYREMVKLHIESVGRCNILASCELRDDSKRGMSRSTMSFGFLSTPRSQADLINSQVNTPSWVPAWNIADAPMLMTMMSWASGCFRSRFTFVEPDTLSVSGVLVAAVRNIQPINHEAITMLGSCWSILESHDYALSNIDENSYNSSEAFIEAFCRTLVANSQWSHDFRHDESALIVERSVELVKWMLLKAQDSSISWPSDVVERRLMKDYVEQMRSVTHRRVLFCTREGRIGLAPRLTLPGDQVVQFLGCDSPMLLRPTKTGRYQVVGEAYYGEARYSQAFLGPLPSGFRVSTCLKYTKEAVESPGFVFRMLEEETMKQLLKGEDPRLGPLPEGWSIERDPNDSNGEPWFSIESGLSTTFLDPRLTPAASLERGVILQDFELV